MAISESGVLYPQVTVQLTTSRPGPHGQDGGFLYVTNRVERAIRQRIGVEASRAWVEQALSCDSYADLLTLARRTVHVE